MSIVKVKEKYQVTIPQDVRKKIPCGIGEYVKVEVKDSHIVIHPPIDTGEKLSEDEISLLQKAFQSPNNQGRKMESHEFKDYLKRV